MADDNNMARVIRILTDDFKYSFNMGIFAGRIDLSIFDNNAKAAPVVKMLFTTTSAVQFKVVLNKIIADQESKPIELSWYPFNRDLKQNEFRSSVVVGRDQDKSIYFDVFGDRHKEPIRFYLVLDRSIRINGMELPKLSATELGCKAILQMMDALIEATLYSPAPKPQGNGEIAPSTSSSLASSVGDDVPF